MHVDPVAIFGPTVVAGMLSMAGVALKVWFDGRDKRRRGHRDIEAAQTQLAFCRDWLAVRDAMGADETLPIPASLAADLATAYDRATQGGDLLADAASRGLWSRIAASILPNRHPTSRWGRVWRRAYWSWFPLAVLFALAIVGSASESANDPAYGPVYNFTLSVGVSVFLFALLCVAPLAGFRHLTHRAEARAQEG